MLDRPDSFIYQERRLKGSATPDCIHFFPRIMYVFIAALYCVANIIAFQFLNAYALLCIP